jgi:PAS domain S-box-containing protein
MTQKEFRLLSLTRTQRYGIAVLGVILTALLRVVLDPVLGADLPLLLFAVPVVVAGWYGGLGPGLLATFLSLLIGDYLFIFPRGSFLIYEDFLTIGRISGFVWVGAVISILAERTRNAIKGRLECLERFGILVDSFPDFAIFTTDLQGHIKCSNAGAERLTGFREEEIMGRPLSIFDAPEDTAGHKLGRKIEIAAAKGRCEHEGWQTRRDGSQFWASGVIAPLRNEAGQLNGFAKVIRDITERKAANDAVDRSQRFLQNIIDISPSIIYIFDLEQRKHVFFNRSAAVALGYDPSQVQKPDFVASLMHPDHWNSFLDHLRRLQSLHDEESADFEYRMRYNDGSWRWFHAREKVFARNADGRVREIIGAASDITEHKSAGERLRDSDDRYRAFVVNSSEGICRFEMDEPVPVTLSEDEQIALFYKRGRIAECNDAFARAHGCSSADQVRGWRMSKLLSISDPERAIANARAFIRSGYRMIGSETRETDVHGNTGYFLTNLIGVQENGCLTRAWATQRDISEQKRAETEREQLLSKEEAARREAEAANRLKDEFLATISHELRTPLTAILGWAHMLTGGALSQSQALHASKVIQRSAQLQSRLVDDILDTSRIITGRFHLEADPIDIGPILQASLDAVRPSAEAKNITLHVASEDRSSMILGDASRVQQIFWNLLSNAIKFTNGGGRVEVRLKRVEDRIEISVIDTGVGIEPHFLPHVFDRFRQADSTSTRKYGGLGLGLAIVRHLAEVQGGRVSASSLGTGMGSTFTITFPALLSTRQPQRETGLPKPESKLIREGMPPSGVNPNLNGVRILIVEDDLETLDMLKFILDQSQAEVTTTAAADEALRYLEQSPVDVLVSDLAMPNQSGYDLIHQVRSLTPDRGGNIPAVALSAYSRAEDRGHALAAGFHLHLSKPIDPAELLIVLARLAGLNDRNAA